MKSNYKTIEDLVIRIDERNFNNETDILLGVSIDKCFIPSVANTIGTDLTKYKLIRKNDFAVSLMQVSRDSRIPIARQKEMNLIERQHLLRLVVLEAVCRGMNLHRCKYMFLI